METTIQISGLSKSYTGNKVIENLSLSVAAGEVYGLLGANGAGKSTTIECILGTREADSGTVRILGIDLILSRLVDTFSSRILYPMLLLSGNHSIAAVLSWEEDLH